MTTRETSARPPVASAPSKSEIWASLKERGWTEGLNWRTPKSEMERVWRSRRGRAAPAPVGVRM